MPFAGPLVSHRCVPKLVIGRNDQLTFVPADEHTLYSTPMLSPVHDEEQHRRDCHMRHGSSADQVRGLLLMALHGTFSAECVIRRAATALEVLETLATSKDDIWERPSGSRLVQSVWSCLEKCWSNGYPGTMWLPSSHACAPVRLDTSEHIRRDFFGLGRGDRVVSAEGLATVLGATRCGCLGDFLLFMGVEQGRQLSVPSTPLRMVLLSGTRVSVAKHSQNILTSLSRMITR